MDVDRVGVLGEVVELPDLGRADLGELGRRLVPAERLSAAVGVECSEVGLGGGEGLAAGAVEDDVAALGADLDGRGLLFVERQLPGQGRRSSGASAGRTSCDGGVLGSGPVLGTTSKRITRPVVAGSAGSKSTPSTPPPNGSSGATLSM